VEILLIKVTPIIILQLVEIDLNYIFQDYKTKLLLKNNKNKKPKQQGQNQEVYLQRRKQNLVLNKNKKSYICK
jgi:uncharacterized protein YijF (DUF1287 family)